MFRDERQRNRVCMKLAATFHHHSWWTEDGPTGPVERVRDGAGSSSEVLLAQVCFDVYNGRGHADFGRALYVFDETRLQLIASLLVAIGEGAEAIELWLDAGDMANKLRVLAGLDESS